jgi:hypothetical protein
MTQLAKLVFVVADGSWPSTKELVQEVRHRSAKMRSVLRRRATRLRDGEGVILCETAKLNGWTVVASIISLSSR